MNRFTRLGRALLSVVALAAVCVSYGQTLPAELFGQWFFADGYNSSDVPKKKIELFSDGTGVADGAASMAWKIENGRLIMLLKASVEIACDYNASDYELSLNCGNNKNTTFVKKGKMEDYKRKKVEEKRKEAERIKKEAEERIRRVSDYFTDSRDGRRYRTVKIGGKRWMAENLRYQAGDAWCYNDDDSYCDKYGRLYYWNTATKVCPAGWRLPSREEWGELAKAAGGTDDYGKRGTAGKALKSASGWDSTGNGTDDFGFSGLPGGYRGSYGDFYKAGNRGVWWTATEAANGRSYSREMRTDYDYVTEEHEDVRINCFSLRCVRDD